jgi:colanic acid biosynthesis glycosyl transferase WcaI
MHILIVSQYFWPEEFRINDLASELVARGHTATVLTGEPNYPKGHLFPAYLSDKAAFSEYNGVNIIRVPLIPRGSGSLRLLLNYFSFVVTSCTIGLWKLRHLDFDVIFSPQLSPVTAMLPAVLIRRIRRRPFAMWVLDLWPDTLHALGVTRSPIILGWVGRLVGFIYHRTDKLFVQSRGFVDNVTKYTTQPVEPEFLPNWSEEIEDLSRVKAAPQIAPSGPETFNLMFAGAIGESQDFPSILAAAELLRDETRLRWLIVGDGRASDWLEKEVKNRNLPNFHLLGRHPVDAMPSFYKHANAMLVALRADPIFAMTIPGKVQSYLAAGKPVLAMLDGEGAKVIEEAKAGYCVPAGNAEELAKAIRQMMQLPHGQLAKLGKNAKQHSQAVFDRKKLIDRIETTLSNLSANRERQNVQL